MTRIAIVADSHFDETSRFDECLRVHDWIAEDIERRGVDLLLHSGDVFERKSTPRERNAVAEWLMAVADHCPVVLARGNHDVVGDLRIFGDLRAAYPIIVEEAADVHRIMARNERVRVAVIAWPRKAELLARLEGSAAEGEQLAADALRNVLRGLGDSLHEDPDPTIPRILLMHAMVRGSQTSTGQPLVGCDFELGLDDLALVRADLYALGHIHMPQEWTIEGAPVIYPGSPRRTAFGEVEEKGYIIAEFDGRKLVKWERVPTPCSPMVLLEARYVMDGERGIFENVSGDYCDAERDGAEVRLRYHVPAAHRQAAKTLAEQVRADLLTTGAAYVKLEEVVVAETRSRAPEVAKALTFEEKLKAYWRAKAFDPGERSERLLAKAVSVEEEVRNVG